MAPASPSAWVVRWAGLIARPGPILDLAAGTGRNANWLRRQGYDVTAIDRDQMAMRELDPGVEAIVADMEDGSPWPLVDRIFAGIVVANYLHRPLFTRIRDALGAGGVLIYETFSLGNERFGRPKNPDYLLRPGELLEFCGAHHLVVHAYECVELTSPKPAMVQRVAARRMA
jgi:SAM-dependent methyltransferase